MKDKDLKYILGGVLVIFMGFTSIASIVLYANIPVEMKGMLSLAVLTFMANEGGKLINSSKIEKTLGETKELVNGGTVIARAVALEMADIKAKLAFLEGQIAGEKRGLEAGAIAAHAEAEAMDKGFDRALPLTTKKEEGR